MTIRQKIAGRFGRNEHWAGEMLGIVTGINLIREWNLMAWLIFALWAFYYISHKLEKITYGTHGYR